MRLGLPLALGLVATTFAGRAQAEEAPSATAPAPETTTVDFGWQIVAADLGALFVGTYATRSTGDPYVLAMPLAAPIVHLAHGDAQGAGRSFYLHTGLTAVGGLATGALTLVAVGSSDKLVLQGASVGALVGAVVAMAIDASSARVQRPVSRPAARNLPVPTVATAPGGGFMIGVAGRL
jgi:hypothetical protein